MNIESDIANALLTEAGNVATQLSLPIAFPDVPFDKGNHDRYLEVLHFTNTTLSPTWGRDAVHRGILQINLVDKLKAGSVGPKQIAGQIADVFHKNRIIWFGSERIKIDQNPTVLTPNIEPAQTEYPVSIPYLVMKRKQG